MKTVLSKARVSGGGPAGLGIAKERVGPEDPVLQALTHLVAARNEAADTRQRMIEEYMRRTDVPAAERVLLAYSLAEGTQEPARINEFRGMEEVLRPDC